MCCVNEFADLIHRWYTLKCANCVAYCIRPTGIVKFFFLCLSFPHHFSLCFLRAVKCLSVQIRHADNVLTWGKKRVWYALLWRRLNNVTVFVLGVSSRLQWVRAREGRKGLNRNWAGMLGAAVLQNIAVFVRRQVISRNTADTWPAAL